MGNMDGNILVSLLTLLSIFGGHKVHSEITCPSYQDIPDCSCFVLEDQLHIQCSGSSVENIHKTLQVLNGPVKIFSVYDLNSNTTILPDGVTHNTSSPVYHLQISHSSLEALSEKSLEGLSKSLESLAIVSGQLKFIPRTTLSIMKRLKILDLEANLIQELGPYSFHNILLQKISLKANLLESISENAFWGLEETLMELDISENKLERFPYRSLQRLRLLSSLKLSWNEIKNLSDLINENNFDRQSKSMLQWPMLKSLNLNSNYLKKLESRTFESMSNIKILQIHLNSIELIDRDCFTNLIYLESIDLSHNKIINVESKTFSNNKRLVSIDLSNNHIINIERGLFTSLPRLKELYLNGNNIIKLEENLFSGSYLINVLHLQDNSLKFIDSSVFLNLKNMTQLRLSDNYLKIIPQDLFSNNINLISLSLDGNLIYKLTPLSFSNLSKLRELRLQNNLINIVQDNVLKGLENINELHLENNRIEYISGIDRLLRIKHLSLSRNQLKQYSRSMIPYSEINSLSLGYNNIIKIDEGTFSNQSSMSILFLGNNKLNRLNHHTFSGLKSLSRLYLQNNNITFIHNDCFKKYTKALTYIDLSHNHLNSIKKHIFSSLAFIEEINLSFNFIHSIDPDSFRNLRSLKVLDLSYNRLTNIIYNNIFKFCGLKILKLGYNSIQFFDFNSNNGAPPSPIDSSVSSNRGNFRNNDDIIPLTELDLSYNQLTSNSIVKGIGNHVPRLVVLQLSGNNLTYMNENIFQGFTLLNFLNLDNSFIINLPGEIFYKNPRLQVVKLNNNFINHLPINLFKNNPIREIHLKNNRLLDFPYQSLYNISNLEILTLTNNRISQLNFNNVLLPRLKQLDLNSNNLTIINGSSLVKFMPLLQVLDFGENNLPSIPINFVDNLTLTQINLGGNSLPFIPTSFLSPYLKSSFLLNMSSNPISRINYQPPHGNENIPNFQLNQNYTVMDLYLNDIPLNYLADQMFDKYTLLNRLVIQNSPVNNIPSNIFSNLKLLNLLDLSQNQINTLYIDSFSGLNRLKSLNLSYNRVNNLPPFNQDLGGLQDLDLSGNIIKTLVPQTFKNLMSLVTLRLESNELKTLPVNLFNPLARLSVLDLSFNSIQIMPTNILQRLELRVSNLKLKENPLNCNCEAKEFWEWIQNHPKLFKLSDSNVNSNQHDERRFDRRKKIISWTMKTNLACGIPTKFKGKPISDINMDEFCTSPSIIKLAVQDVQTSSAVVSWQGRNSSARHGYVVVYHPLDDNNSMKSLPLPATSRVYRLPNLQSDTPYKVCVISEEINNSSSSANVASIKSRSANSLLKDSPISKCAQIRTSAIQSIQGSLIQRRLGLIVGATVGILVFFVLIITMICVKIKKKRMARHQNGSSSKYDDKSGQVMKRRGTNGKGMQQQHSPGAQMTHFDHHMHHPNNGTCRSNKSLRSTSNDMRNGNDTSSLHGVNHDFITYRHFSINANDTNGQSCRTDLERL